MWLPIRRQREKEWVCSNQFKHEGEEVAVEALSCHLLTVWGVMRKQVLVPTWAWLVVNVKLGEGRGGEGREGGGGFVMGCCCGLAQI